MNSTFTSRDLEFIGNGAFDQISVGDRARLTRLLQYVRPLEPLRIAVVYPCDDVSLSAAMDAQAAGLIEPVLIAPVDRLLSISEAAGIDLEQVTIEDVPCSDEAAAYALELALEGNVEAVMQGSLGAEELLSAVIASALRTERPMSHCLMMHTAASPRALIMTDAPSAGSVLGARVPVLLAGRPDTREARIASCALALVAARRPTRPPFTTAAAFAQPAWFPV